MFKSKLRVVLAIIASFFVLFLTFTSILGENNRTENIAEAYFTDIKKKKYDSLASYYTKSGKANFASLSEIIEFHLLLELALQKYFDINNLQKSTVFIKRSDFWIPFVKEPYIQLNIALVEEQDESVWSMFAGSEPTSIRNLITLERDNGIWKIASINIEGSEIDAIFKAVKAEMKVQKYILIQGNELVMNSTKIDINNTSMLERKKLIHELEAAVEVIKSINQ